MLDNLRWFLRWVKNPEYVEEICEEMEKKKERADSGFSEFNELGIICADKIDKVDKGVARNLYTTFASIVSAYLRIYNKENLKSNHPLVYKKALHPNQEFNDYEQEYLGTVEELDEWANIIEETANKFDALLGDAPFQEEVNDAFDMLKKIFLGLWLI